MEFIIIGALVDWLVMRPVAAHAKGSASGVTQVIATLGLLGMFEALSGLIWGGEPRPYPTPVSTQGLEIAGTQVAFSLFNVFTVVTVVIVMIIFSILIQRTRLGLALRAAAFRPDIAALSGIRVNRMRLLGWALAGAAGGVAGVLITTPPNNLSPNALDLVLVFGFTAAVIGGLDSLIGAVAFGIGTGLVLALVTGYGEAGDAPIVVLILLAITLVARPGGAFGRGKSRAV